MKEFDPVQSILENHFSNETNSFQSGLACIKENLFKVVEELKKNSTSFLQVAQKMTVALNIVLLCDNEQDIYKKLNALKFQNLENFGPHLQKIRETFKTDSCRDVVREIQNSFSANCITEANVLLADSNKQLVLLQYSGQLDKEKIEKAQKLVSTFQKKYEQISGFCEKYKVN